MPFYAGIMEKLCTKRKDYQIRISLSNCYLTVHNAEKVNYTVVNSEQ